MMKKDARPRRSGAKPAPAQPAASQDLLRRGRTLDPQVRGFFESRFGHDFSQVRIHSDEEADADARSHGARAFTFGQHVVFAAGEFAPETPRGRGLLAHELAHVLQQHPSPHPLRSASPGLYAPPAAETAARGLAARALRGDRPGPVRSRTSPVVARQEIGVDLEVPPPERLEELRRLGIQLPTVSAAGANPRAHSDYVDTRLNAVGFGIYLGGYLVYCDGLPLPVFVPESHVEFGLTSAAIPDPAIYTDRAAAMAAVPFGPPAQGQPARNVTFYRGAGGALIAPTVFSPATTPRFVETALRARQRLAAEVQEALAVLAVSIVGGMALRAIINRIARIGRGGSEAPQPRVPPGTGAAVGREMAREMGRSGFRGNPFREFQRRLNARPQRLPPDEAAEAIRVATTEFNPTMGTMPPVQRGNILVVPSRAPIPNAPVMGIRSDGTVIMGRAPRIDIVRDARGVPVNPPQARIEGDITWE